MPASFLNCTTIRSTPCVEVELINCECERWPLNQFQSAQFSPAINGMGEFTLRFCESDIPEEFQRCCTGIEVVLEWKEAGIERQTIYSGVFNSGSGFVNLDEDIVEWSGRNLLDKLNDTYVAYKSGEDGGRKGPMNAALATYEFLVENLVTPLPNRGDGTDCARQMPGNIIVNPPPQAVLDASDPDWTGGRSYDSLLDIVTKIGNNNDFAVVGSFDDNCNCVFDFVPAFDNSGTILSECLENVQITRINSSCERYNRIHMLGSGEGEERVVVTVCDDSVMNGCCYKELKLSRNQEDDPEALRVEGEEYLASQDGRDSLQFRSRWGCQLIPFRDLFINEYITLEYGGENRVFLTTEMPFALSYSNSDGIQLSEISAVFKEEV